MSMAHTFELITVLIEDVIIRSGCVLYFWIHTNFSHILKTSECCVMFNIDVMAHNQITQQESDSRHNVNMM